MDVYVYQAALLCESCAQQTMAQLGSDANSEDSDRYPQGPYGNGGGEADAPCHCDKCHTFLRNPLTSDGVAYVRDQLATPRGNMAVLDEWRGFYRHDLS